MILILFVDREIDGNNNINAGSTRSRTENEVLVRCVSETRGDIESTEGRLILLLKDGKSANE